MNSNRGSGSGGRRLSRAERAVLERQRQLAAQLGGGGGKSGDSGEGLVGRSTSVGGPPYDGGDGGGKRGGAAAAAPAPASSLQRQQMILQQARQRQQQGTAAAARAAPKPTYKRPSASGQSSSSRGHPTASSAKVTMPGTGGKSAARAIAATAEDAVAAARARLSGAAAGGGGTATAGTATVDSKKAPTGAGSGGMASSILSNLTSATIASQNRSRMYYCTVECDDYWRDIRKWNIVKDLEAHLSSSSTGQKKEKANSNPSAAAAAATPSSNSRSSSPVPTEHKVIPDRFECADHYMSTWAPLCLSENRAQLLSEFASKVTDGRRPLEAIPASVTPLKQDLGGNTDYISVQVKLKKGKSGRGGGEKERDYTSNDILLLVRSEMDVLRHSPRRRKNADPRLQHHTTGTDASSSILPSSVTDRKGLCGHMEKFYSYRTDTLVCKVSRRFWKDVGSPEMFLFRLGSNVTALREFTALCNVKRCPLLPYIIGTDRQPNSEGTGGGVAQLRSERELLAEMGGSQALGKGFANYARQKFNTSQLGAISASAREYGQGGFTLVKGPPGTGKTTTLVALVNALHIRQFNKFYEEIRKMAMTLKSKVNGMSYKKAVQAKPRILVCAPSNAAVDNIILKIMEVGFVDGNGHRYNPSMVRVGSGQSEAVKAISLADKVESIMTEGSDLSRLQGLIAGYQVELGRTQTELNRMRSRAQAIRMASPFNLAKGWEIRIDEETFDETGRVYFVNHKEKSTSFELPTPPEPGQEQVKFDMMPEYVKFIAQMVKLVERFDMLSSKLERYQLLNSSASTGREIPNKMLIRQHVETLILDSTHVVLTTLGTSGSKILEGAAKFEVVVVDEAGQSIEPAALSALELGSSHAILVGDPQQLPATIFSLSGRDTKFDRSLFQRLEESGHSVHLLNTQYRMHPNISDFPRRIFYEGRLLDGQNVKDPKFGSPFREKVLTIFPALQPLTLLDLDSKEAKSGTSLKNIDECQLALFLYRSLDNTTDGMLSKMKVAIISPYSEQVRELKHTFTAAYGAGYDESRVEINTVDSFQGREANVVIFSCVRASGSRGIGFLSDVRRMNVGLTRAKHFLFIIAHCRSIVVNPYWKDLVDHARETSALIRVPMTQKRGRGGDMSHVFGDLRLLRPAPAPPPPPHKSRMTVQKRPPGVNKGHSSDEDGQVQPK